MPSPTPSPLPAILACSIAAVLSCGPREDPDLAFHRGVNALDEQRFENARTYFAEDLEHHPERLESWLRAGRSWMSGNLKSPTRATAAWRRYLELNPGDNEITIQMTRALLFLGEWQQAQTWCQRLDASGRSQLLRARVFLEVDPERARQAIEAAAPAAGDDPYFHAEAARVYHHVAEPERARGHASRAIELAPLDLKSTYLLARLQQQLGDAEAAAELLVTHQLLAQLTGSGGAPEPAPAEALRLMRELEPRVASEAEEFRLRKLRLLVANGRHQEAQALLANLAESTRLPATRIELAGLAEKLGDLAAAHRLLESVLSDEPSGAGITARADRAAREREALYGLALLARRRYDRAGSRKRVEDGLERFPHAGRFYHLLGRIELEAGRDEAAAGRFEKALELAPWKTECRIDLANLWLSQGRSDTVAALLAQAPGPDPVLDRYRRRHDL